MKVYVNRCIYLNTFFEVDVQLAVPSVRLSPSLEDIQRAVNKGALAVLRVSKSIWLWGQGDINEETATSDWLVLLVRVAKVSNYCILKRH